VSIAAEQDLLDRLRLIRSANIGPVTYFQLLARFGKLPQRLPQSRSLPRAVVVKRRA
jgi:hypothetical protein